MPSRPSLQACSNTMSPGWSRCTLNWKPGLALGASPATTLSVAGNTYSTGGLGVGIRNTTAGNVWVDGNTSSAPGVLLYSNGTKKWTIANQSADVHELIVLDAEGDNGVQITQNSNAWTSTSDARLKENIQPYSVLDKIDAFTMVSFNWKSSGRHDIGAIAQEVYKIFPEVVTPGSATGTVEKIGDPGVWGIMYSQLAPIALEGVKELYQKLTELANTVAAFTDKIITHLLAADRIETNELCVGDTCVTPDQFKAMAAAAGSSFCDLLASSRIRKRCVGRFHQ
jgi:hypothetical protein